MGILKNASLGLSGILYFASVILGIAIHVWTILISYAVSGFVGAMITVITPFFSEFYWAYFSIKMSGSYLNTYTILLFGYLILLVVAIAFSAIGVIGEE